MGGSADETNVPSPLLRSQTLAIEAEQRRPHALPARLGRTDHAQTDRTPVARKQPSDSENHDYTENADWKLSHPLVRAPEPAP